MQNLAKQSAKTLPVPRNWEKNESVFTGDDLIDAYLEGKEAGKNELVNVLTTQFRNNIKLATETAEKLRTLAKKIDVNFISIHLKADAITNFLILFVADKQDFISDKFRNLYVSSRKLKAIVDNENFIINFSFMPYSAELNEKCLNADGFFLKYDKK